MLLVFLIQISLERQILNMLRSYRKYYRKLMIMAIFMSESMKGFIVWVVKLSKRKVIL